MSGEVLLFRIFAAVVCAGALAVVLSQNVVRMAFWMVVSLGSVAGLFFLLDADFVAATQLLIYVGGTVVLLVFGVMLTASGPYLKIPTSPAQGVVAGAVGLLLLSLLMWSVSSVDWDSSNVERVLIAADQYEKALESAHKHEAGLRTTLAEKAGLSKVPGGHAMLHDVEDHPDKFANAEAEKDAWMHAYGELEFVEDSYVQELIGETAVHRFHAVEHEEDDPHHHGSGHEFGPAELLAFWKEHGLTFAPDAEVSGSSRTLGLGFLGYRPDRDLAPSGLKSLRNGFYLQASSDDLSTGYLLPFEIVSIHLLVVLVGAAYLARAKRRADLREG